MLSKADPRSKLCVVAVLSTLAIFYNNVFPLVFLLFVAALCTALFGGKRKELLISCKNFLNVILVIALIQSVFVKGGKVLVELFSVPVLTQNGIATALSFVLRMFIILCSAFILSTSSDREIIQGLIQMKIPYEIAFMSLMGIRFLPQLKEQIQDTVVAIQLRGIDLRKLKLTEKIRLFSTMLAPVVAGAVVHARQVSMSIQLRAFRAYDKRTSRFQLTLGAKDIAILFVSFAFFLCFVLAA
ncbi:energy-coupling factor transporter transmembrane component T [Hydrogenoanaerobacterium sp.]|uniref:energy-coupling factor transporter transmembrane component T family protein n=1 Tax=Hydrogenoanaerobacterium sp. TaxID=2953763 RepID=UPI00289EBD6D|nr:energy-coupling factor transporter transmembrane component T [Hydrogenoanaerobacterium sp.]